jgi:hypothetical protein
LEIDILLIRKYASMYRVISSSSQPYGWVGRNIGRVPGITRKSQDATEYGKR